MTKEKNIDASAEKYKFADEILSDDELDNVAGGTYGKIYDDRSPFDSGIRTTGKISPPVTTGK